MNQKKPDYKRLYQIVVQRFKKAGFTSYGPLDETYYTMRVFETAKTIMTKIKEPCHRELVLVAAVIHDIGKTVIDAGIAVNETQGREKARIEWKRHPELGGPAAKQILQEEGYDPKFIEKVVYLVVNHGHKVKDASIELQVLQDADLIADCGIAGFIRPMLYGGTWKRPVIDSIGFMKTMPSRVGELDELNLAVSKKLALQAIKRERELVEELVKTTQSELLD